MPRRLLLLCALALLAGCGGGTAERERSAPAARATATPTPAAHGHELVYLSRNVESAIPEDVSVFADGSVRYRYLLHTRVNIPVRTTTLPPRSMKRLHRLLARTDLDGAQALGVDPPRGRFRYLLRIGGRSITTVDGHLAPGVKPLITRLGRLEDRMLARGEDR
jgi:hypothetical protein